mmetsp:Transcript_8776/g.22088  ORF Transcript_8776/g.22088 Transcript_8776/m.22088 type:complete len:201 (-) Transcript_8776:29-631(-)
MVSPTIRVAFPALSSMDSSELDGLWAAASTSGSSSGPKARSNQDSICALAAPSSAGSSAPGSLKDAASSSRWVSDSLSMPQKTATPSRKKTTDEDRIPVSVAQSENKYSLAQCVGQPDDRSRAASSRKSRPALITIRADTQDCSGGSARAASSSGSLPLAPHHCSRGGTSCSPDRERAGAGLGRTPPRQALGVTVEDAPR